MTISLTPGYTRDIKIRGQLHTTRPDWNQTKLNQPSRHFSISTTVMWLNKIKGASDRLYDQIMVQDRSEYTGWSNRSHWRYLCFDQYSRGTPGLIWRSVSDSRRLSVNCSVYVTAGAHWFSPVFQTHPSNPLVRGMFGNSLIGPGSLWAPITE